MKQLKVVCSARRLGGAKRYRNHISIKKPFDVITPTRTSGAVFLLKHSHFNLF
ncbi:hypothetical protein laban61_gp022 [Flavobacterium phage vB_FspS_laban6-1]|uniref:Uncharacterized protein n=1 Tax=Flavobacterium phage vB_FspS_laban6-1 TaxID=2686250 RepID=A0A6B9LC59_9CAUD|nr:hypothetical protein HWC90_gp22 [Flavobacterium phage vB_FspS_laban6-1]QHB38993.1 hypothetical protein laban61_gp022 [Flavobacterium phage vB_FspS_laban6-1]